VGRPKRSPIEARNTDFLKKLKNLLRFLLGLLYFASRFPG